LFPNEPLHAAIRSAFLATQLVPYFSISLFWTFSSTFGAELKAFATRVFLTQFFARAVPLIHWPPERACDRPESRGNRRAIFCAMLRIGAVSRSATRVTLLFSRRNSELMKPRLLPSMPFMNFGPNVIARLMSPPAASFASDIMRSAVAAFSSAEAPAAICDASTTPLNAISAADVTNEIASQMKPMMLSTRATPETAAPIGGKIIARRPMTVRTIPILPQMLPTMPEIDLITDMNVMILPSVPPIWRYGFVAQTALTSLPMPRKFDTLAMPCSTAPPCAT